MIAVWIAAIAAVGMFGVLGQLLMNYQKRAHKFRLRQAPLRKRIRSFNEKIAKAGADARDEASEKTDKLEEGHEIGDLWVQHMVVMLDKVDKAQLDQEEEERREERKVESKKADQVRADLRQSIKDARGQAEKVETYLSGMRSDIDLAKQTLTLLNMRLAKKDRSS